MGRLPILTVDGKYQIGQSKAIERYLAKKFGFFGSTLEEEARIDSIGEHIRDLVQQFSTAKGKPADEVDAAKAKFYADLPSWFAKLEKVLDGDRFAVGDKLSLADVYIRQFLKDLMGADKAALAQAATGFTKILGITLNVEASAKSYFDSRPQHPF